MGFKSFIKPTIGKIIITIALSLVFLFLLFPVQTGYADCIGCGGFISIDPINIDISDESGNFDFQIKSIIYLVEILVSYLIACFLILAIQKVKK